MLKAILIDVFNKEIKEIEIQEGIDPIYEQLKCNLFTTIDLGYDTLYVNDEGLYGMDEDTKFFEIEGYDQPLSGNGVILGYNRSSGDSCNTTLYVDKIKEHIKFRTMNDVRNHHIIKKFY